MTRFRLSLFLLSLLYASSVFATQTPQEYLVQAHVFQREGRAQEAITLARSLIDHNALSGFDMAAAWTIIGLASEDEEDFDSARRAYEQALPLLEDRPAFSLDYADVLANLADLYRDMRQFAPAITLRIRALNIYKQQQAHARLATSYASLAGIELSQGHKRNAGRYLSQALTEMRVAEDLDPDDRATIYSIQGWKAELDRKPFVALSSYQSALELWLSLHGEAHPFSAWGHYLVGKAYQDIDSLQSARDQMLRALKYLRQAPGIQTARYSEVELSYSYLLDKMGEHDQALEHRRIAQGELDRLNAARCSQCSISAQTHH